MQGPQHELVPVLAGAAGHVPGVGVFTHQFPAGDGHLQQQPRKIAGEHQVAAAAEDETALARRHRSQLGRIGHLQVMRRAAGQGEGVEGGEVDLGMRRH
ncbi:hypothetical protein SDC9_147363 [bioreactor metagenome]|uniref:Uncharacterized protein n=1 Tax=bioreactor metagenome TaxID=1076179 RepID=A0A645EGB6_9ZZZZ